MSYLARSEQFDIRRNADGSIDADEYFRLSDLYGKYDTPFFDPYLWCSYYADGIAHTCYMDETSFGNAIESLIVRITTYCVRCNKIALIELWKLVKKHNFNRTLVLKVFRRECWSMDFFIPRDAVHEDFVVYQYTNGNSLYVFSLYMLKKGAVEANYLLGNCFFYGIGVVDNINEAIRYYTTANRNNIDIATSKLAECYEKIGEYSKAQALDEQVLLKDYMGEQEILLKLLDMAVKDL